MASVLKILLLTGVVCVLGCRAMHVDPARSTRSIHVDGIGLSSGAVRCFCNLPVCVGMGYMCKTDVGCFSDLVDQVDVSRARHGCQDLPDALPKGRQSLCQNQPQEPSQQITDQPYSEQDQDALQGRANSLLLCCRKDMCNHIDSPEAKWRHQQLNSGTAPNVSEDSRPSIGMQPSPGGGAFADLSGISGDTGHAEFGGAALGGGASPGSGPSSTADRVAAWFRAATIVVPICGAVILLMLIALAVRILRTDSQIERSSKLRMKQSAFVPLLLPNHNIGVSPLSFVATPGAVVRTNHPGQWVNRLHQNMATAAAKNVHNAKLNSVGQPGLGGPAAGPPNLIDLNKDSCGPTNNCNMFAAAADSQAAFPPKLNYKTVAAFNSWGSDHAPADV